MVHCDAACRGQRVIYTTPLKALSNQKLFEMRERFGTERVGLSTGDASIQTDSAIMVMTTEILRNIMYRTEEEAEDKSTNRDALADVGLVVLDEVRLKFLTLVLDENLTMGSLQQIYGNTYGKICGRTYGNICGTKPHPVA